MPIQRDPILPTMLKPTPKQQHTTLTHAAPKCQGMPLAGWFSPAASWSSDAMPVYVLSGRSKAVDFILLSEAREDSGGTFRKGSKLYFVTGGWGL